MTRCYIVVKYLQPATSIQAREAVTRPSPCLWEALLATALTLEDFSLFNDPPEDDRAAAQRVVANPKPQVPPDVFKQLFALQAPEAMAWIKRMHALDNVRNLTEFCSRSDAHVPHLKRVTKEWIERFHLNGESHTEPGKAPHIAAFRSAWRQLRELMVRDVPGFAEVEQKFEELVVDRQRSILKDEETLRKQFEQSSHGKNIKQKKQPPPASVPMPVPTYAETPSTSTASAAGQRQPSRSPAPPENYFDHMKQLIQNLRKKPQRERAFGTTGRRGGEQRPGTSRAGAASAKPKPEKLFCEKCPYEDASDKIESSWNVDFGLLSVALHQGFAKWEADKVDAINATWTGQVRQKAAFWDMYALTVEAFEKYRNHPAPNFEAAGTSTESQARETEATPKAANLEPEGLKALPCYHVDKVVKTLYEVVTTYDQKKDLLTLCKASPLANDINVFLSLCLKLPSEGDIEIDYFRKALKEACTECVCFQTAPKSRTADPTSEPLERFKRMCVKGRAQGPVRTVLVGRQSCTPTECKHRDAEHWMSDFVCQLRSAFPRYVQRLTPSEIDPETVRNRNIGDDCPFDPASGIDIKKVVNIQLFAKGKTSIYLESAIRPKDLVPAVWRRHDARDQFNAGLRSWLEKRSLSMGKDAFNRFIEGLKKVKGTGSTVERKAEDHANVKGTRSTVESEAEDHANVKGTGSTVESEAKNVTDKLTKKALPTYSRAKLQEVLDKILGLKDDAVKLVRYRKTNALANDLCIVLSLVTNLESLRIPNLTGIVPSEQCIWFTGKNKAVPRASAPLEIKRDDDVVKCLEVLLGANSCNESSCKHINADNWGQEFLCQLGRAFASHRATKEEEGTKKTDRESGTDGGRDDGGKDPSEPKKKRASKKQKPEQA